MHQDSQTQQALLRVTISSIAHQGLSIRMQLEHSKSATIEQVILVELLSLPRLAERP